MYLSWNHPARPPGPWLEHSCAGPVGSGDRWSLPRSVCWLSSPYSGASGSRHWRYVTQGSCVRSLSWSQWWCWWISAASSILHLGFSCPSGKNIFVYWKNMILEFKSIETISFSLKMFNLISNPCKISIKWYFNKKDVQVFYFLHNSPTPILISTELGWFYPEVNPSPCLTVWVVCRL